MRLKPVSQRITSQNVIDWFVLALWLAMGGVEFLLTHPDDRLFGELFFLIVSLCIGFNVLEHVRRKEPPQAVEP